jgi:cytochrome b6
MQADSHSSKIYQWLDARLKLGDLVAFMSKKSVPVYRGSFWYYFGGVSLFLFIIQVITGILLLLYYNPSADLAFQSVQFIVSKVKFGWLIRSVHSWSANLMVLAVFIHMFSVFFTKAYRFPRELTWMTGVILLVLCFAFGFSGYLLPWNELSFFATKVGTDIVGVFPLVGDFLLILLRGGEEVTGATVSRFFGFHVALMPGIFTIVLAVHLILIQRQGMHEPDTWKALPDHERKTMPFFPNFLLRDLLLWLIVLNVLAILAVFFPWELGRKADPFASAPAGIRPEWYFMFMFQTLKFLPAHILVIDGEVFGVLLFMVGGVLWFFIPFWDRKTEGGRRGKILNYIGVIAALYIVVMTIVGYLVS